MNYSILLTQTAEDDLYEAYIWYEEKSVGLGEKLAHEFVQTAQQASKTPHRFSPLRKVEGRKAKLKSFPYHIYFYVNEAWKRIEIVALIHTARHPRVWKRRF
jgi:plasmid stabilization system protein ParE